MINLENIAIPQSCEAQIAFDSHTNNFLSSAVKDNHDTEVQEESKGPSQSQAQVIFYDRDGQKVDSIDFNLILGQN